MFLISLFSDIKNTSYGNHIFAESTGADVKSIVPVKYDITEAEAVNIEKLKNGTDI